jgi:CRP/FNR family cyclic AMP-dependent transcriptional regulator
MAVDTQREPLEICRVLEEDPELAEALPPEQREQATRECLARTVTIEAGPWRGSPGIPAKAEGIGRLVLSGLLIRRVGVDGRFGAELLGAGDLLRPWQGDEQPPIIPVSTAWQVIETSRVALLDESFVRRIGRYPQLTGRLVGRALRRSRNLAVYMAIVHHARVDVRLHTLLWYLAGRWGRVGSDGVVLPLRLTHNVLADLTAARRPTVTSALSELSRSGLVQTYRDGWLLVGKPPGELIELGAVPTELTADPVQAAAD